MTRIIEDLDDIHPAPDAAIPVLVVAETAKPRDYISMGLMDADDYRAYIRGQWDTGRPVILHQAFAIIRYNAESGSLQGLASRGFRRAGEGYTVTRSASLASPLVLSRRPVYLTALGPGVWDQANQVAAVGS